MDKKLLIVLIVGIVIGFPAGYFVGTQQTPAPVHQMAAGQAMTQQQGADANQGMTQEQQAMKEQMSQQIQALQAELAKDPNNVKLLVNLGNMYYDTREFQQAIDTYQKALKLEPSNIMVQVDLATAYNYLGQTDKAVEGLKAVLDKEPNQPQALYNLGIIMLHGKNNLEAAKEYWTRLIKTGTDQIDLKLVQQRLDVINGMIERQKQSDKQEPTPKG